MQSRRCAAPVGVVEVAPLQLAGQARERLLPQQPEQHDACRQPAAVYDKKVNTVAELPDTRLMWAPAK
jgi:hypothetical protein